MSQEVFRQLSTEFQRAWCEFGRITFPIEIVAPGVISTDYPPFDHEKYELLAQVCLPLDSSQKITADHENSTFFGYATVKKNDHTKAASETFADLCRRAGAALPHQVRDDLAGLVHWDMPDPASWWLALLVYLSGGSAYSPDGRYHGTSQLLRPFLSSCDAIDRCGLTTDDPKLPVFGAGNGEEPIERVNQHEKLTNEKVERSLWLAEAMLLVRDHPEWSDAEIARQVKRHASTLSRSKEYQLAASLSRSSKGDRRRGFLKFDPVSRQRDVEAYADDTAERDWDE